MEIKFQVSKSVKRPINWKDKKTGEAKTAEIVEVTGLLQYSGGVIYTTIRHHVELPPGNYDVALEFKNASFNKLEIIPRIIG